MQRALSDSAKNNKKMVILAAALDEFYLHGLKATKMADIAKRSQISKGTLYLYFRSKEDLFASVIKKVALTKAAQIHQLLNAQNDVAAGLDQLFIFFTRAIVDSPMPKLIKVLISESKVFPDIVQTYKTNIIDPILVDLETLLAKGVATGQVTSDDPKTTAKLVIAPVMFSVVWTILFEPFDDPPLDVHQLMQQHKQLLLTALGIDHEPS